MCSPDCADDVVCLFGSGKHEYCASDKLAGAVASFGVGFASSKCKVLLKDWGEMVPNLMLDGEEQTSVDSFSYFCGCMMNNGSIILEMGTRT